MNSEIIDTDVVEEDTAEPDQDTEQDSLQLPLLATPTNTQIVPQAHATVELSLDPDYLAQFIVTWKQGGTDLYAMSVEGYAHIAQAMGLQVTSMVDDERSETYMYGTGRAYNPFTGHSFDANVRYPKKYQNGREDLSCYTKTDSCAKRNAIKRAVSQQLVADSIEAYKDGKGQNSPVAVAQRRMKSAGEHYRNTHMETLGVDTDTILKESELRYGHPSEWNVEIMLEIASALRNPKGTWLEDLVN